MIESITEGSVLLWDEPEANLNPELYSTLTQVLLELSRKGVQVFIATHSYDLAKFVDVLRAKTDSVSFHSLYHTDKGVECETASSFQNLKHNSINKAASELHNAIIRQDIEDLEDE